jgi:hypothetical protein
MSTKEAPFIVFRHLVQQMERDGAFKAPEDALLYSIKERQPLEITAQISSTKRLDVFERHPIYYSQSEKKGSHLANIFFREDYLSPDDYSYLFSVMKMSERSKVLETLVKNECIDHDILNGVKSQWIRAFLEYCASTPLELPKAISAGQVLQEQRLVKLLMAYFPDPEKVVAMHLGIERMLDEDTRAQRNHIEVKHLKNAGDLESPTDIERWLKTQKVIEGLRRENQKTIVGSKQSNVLLNQISAFAKIEEAGAQGMAAKSQVISAIKAMVKEDLGLLIEVMKLPASKAIETFGKAGNKGDGERIPSQLKEFADLLETTVVQPDQRKQVLSLMVTRLCEVNQKNMASKEVTMFIDHVKDQVDWEGVVGFMNAKGRKTLMETFTDTSYYRGYLKRDERGKTLESEMGL